jgi:hypothetical protein
MVELDRHRGFAQGATPHPLEDAGYFAGGGSAAITF